MQITCKDFTLRQMHEIKVDLWVKFHQENRFYVENFTYTKQEDYYNLEIQQKFMVQSIIDFERDEGYCFGVLNQKNKLIARVKSHRDNDPNLNYADIRLLMDHRYRTQDLAVRIIKCMIKFLFEDRKVHRVYFTVLENDDFMLEVVKLLPVTFEGRTIKTFRINGVWQDHLLYSLINPNM